MTCSSNRRIASRAVWTVQPPLASSLSGRSADGLAYEAHHSHLLFETYRRHLAFETGGAMLVDHARTVGGDLFGSLLALFGDAGKTKAEVLGEFDPRSRGTAEEHMKRHVLAPRPSIPHRHLDPAEGAGLPLDISPG